MSGGVARGGVEIKKDQIVYVGRLSKEKGVETLIKSFKIVNYDGGGGGNIPRSQEQ